MLICEGWATGATLAESEPDALVLAAVDAYNMEAVAVGARQKWPDVAIVICGDCDAVGEERARIAAKAAGALVAFPDFPDGVEGSDFNDAAVIHG
ncbi:MAG: toprim domain-containing protein [Salinisphaera sp.]|nr:toprim domain-containing protein [Salinisphaera sp.]